MEEAVLIADHKPLVKILGAETDYLADTLQKWTLRQTSYHYDIIAKLSEKQSKAVLFLLTIRDEKVAAKNPSTYSSCLPPFWGKWDKVPWNESQQKWKKSLSMISCCTAASVVFKTWAK